MDIQVNRLGQIEAEDAHDGLGVDHISAGYQIKSTSNLVRSLTERFYFIDGI